MLNHLLTIIIPTFNRAECLSLLLTTLTQELYGLEDKVKVIISNNASTDHTNRVLDNFSRANPDAQILQQLKNFGPDENFCKCIDQVKTRFFWIIGDDDLPKTGLLRHIVNFLDHEDIDIIYLNSEWLPHITSADDGISVSELTFKTVSREDFARKVNVWVTFISGIIINLERLHKLNPGLDIRRFTETSLVQLGWVLPLLMTGNNFKIIKEHCILATGGNSGGYKLLTVFGTNFPKILHAVCGPASREFNLIKKSLVWSYLPGLLWGSRFRKSSTFIEENMFESLRPLKKCLAYWVLMLPIAKFPFLLAMPFLIISKIFTYLGKR